MQTHFLSSIESRIYDHGQIYARFHLGTFFRGQALTIANALRRTLLSQVPGIVIERVEIQDATHEFATLPDVQESVLDIVLNLKKLVFTTSLENGIVTKQEVSQNSIFLKIHGPAQVTAADLKLPPHIACVNPQAHIATISSTGELAFNLVLKRINPSHQRKRNSIEQKFSQNKVFYLNTVPAPIQKVNYLIQEVDPKNGSELIALEIWTDGSLTPIYALQFALKQLTKFFFDFSRLTQTTGQLS